MCILMQYGFNDDSCYDRVEKGRPEEDKMKNSRYVNNEMGVLGQLVQLCRAASAHVTASCSESRLLLGLYSTPRRPWAS